MAWTLLPTDYTDAVWSGLKKYLQVDNPDGTVSLQDVTVYTSKEKSFFGAIDANRMNEALNIIMSMVESGTNLYEAFQAYFVLQQQLFETRGNQIIDEVQEDTDIDYSDFLAYIANLKATGSQNVEDAKALIDAEYAAFLVYSNGLETTGNSIIENIRAMTNSQYDDFLTYLVYLRNTGDASLSEIETAYELRMANYESEQKALFDAWFANVINQLSSDVAGQLQNSVDELDGRLAAIEHMALQNDFTAPISVDDSGTSILVDDLGFAIVIDWQYKKEV